MSTLREIKSAIGRLNSRGQALLAAKLFTLKTEPEEKEVERSLERGLADVEAGRVHPIGEIKSMISAMDSKVLIAESAIADLKAIVRVVVQGYGNVGLRACRFSRHCRREPISC